MNQTKKVIIFGIGGTSVDILDVINDINREGSEEEFECIGFLDDEESNIGKMINNVKVLGLLNLAKDFKEAFFINGIGSPESFLNKEEIIKKSEVSIDRFVALIHPTASVSKTAVIGNGSIIFQNVVISANVQIGNHVVVLPSSIISHNDTIGDYTCVATGVCISGKVNVGESCYLGANCTLKEDIVIGDHSLVGMGSVVLSDVSINSVFVGNPAKFLKKVF